MELRSSAYRPGGAVPLRYTCDGEGISPAFTWQGEPPQTKSFVLLLHDPDAPSTGGFTHWLIFDIDPRIHQIDEGSPKEAPFADFGVQGSNDGNSLGYLAPCPPSGTHRYIARLFSLDVQMSLAPGATRQEVEAAMEGHILDQAALMGTYTRKRKAHQAA